MARRGRRDPVDTTLYRKIVGLYKAKEANQYELAERFSLSQSTIHRIISGIGRYKDLPRKRGRPRKVKR